MQEQVAVQESRLENVGEQLKMRMVLVSDEQKVLDELKDKTKTMKERLEVEAAKMEQNKLTPTVAAPPPPTPNAKDALKQKLVARKASLLLSPPTATPQPPPSETPTPSATPTPSPQSEVANQQQGPLVPCSDQRFTSSTHPQAWHCLYRMCRKSDSCDKEIYDMWRAGLVDKF